MERQVALLLLEQKKLRRLDLELPPDKLLLLQRLLYRLGYTKMSRKILTRYIRLTLSQSRPSVSFGGESLNEHDVQDEQGNVVGNIKLRDRGPILHVDWIGGKGKYAGGNLLGNEAMRSIHDAIATHYPKAEYLRGHRISGFRGREAAVGSPVVIPIRRRTKMSRNNKPIRYAKWDHTREVHPLLHGFPISHALIHIANSPQSTDSAKNLAVAALKGHTEALWGLHDELKESNHPILSAGYKWLNAADKLHLDKHTYTALNEAAERRRAEEPHAEHRIHGDQYQWRYTPEYQAINAAMGITAHPSSLTGQHHQTIFNRVKELSPNSIDEDINESIRRHAHRAVEESQRRITGSSPDTSHGNALRHHSENPRINALSRKNEIATRYQRKPTRYSLANKSNFIGSLLKVSSPGHKLFVQRTKELARKAGAQQTKEFPALHDTPQQSVPGVALAIYGHIQPDSAHALGSWVNGLLPNSPGYAVFHARSTGPDTLYRIRMEGSGHDARAKLDRAGISSRVFVPHRKGLDILIPDKGNRMTQNIQNFASQQKVPIESSPGHLTTVGSQDQEQARDTFRNKVSKVGMSRQSVRRPDESSRKDWSLVLRRYAIFTPTKPQKSPNTIPISRRSESSYDLPSRARQNLGSHIETNLPTSKPSIPPINKLPKGVRQKEYNPTVVPPKEKPLFSTGELNKLHKWADNHARTHTPAFSKFLGSTNLRDDRIHKFLVKSIIHAAHEMRRSGKSSVTIGIGKTGKRLKINTPRTSWVGVKTDSKVVKPPPNMEVQPRLNPKDLGPKKPKKSIKKTLSRFERRRRTYRSLSSQL